MSKENMNSGVIGAGLIAAGALSWFAWSYYNRSSEESVDSTDSIVKKDEAKDKLLEVAEKNHDAKVCMAELAAKYKLKEAFVEMLNLIEDIHVKGGDLNYAMLPKNGEMAFEEIKTHHKSHGFEMMQEYSNFKQALVLDEENVSHNGNTMLMLMARENQLDLELGSDIIKKASESYIKHVNKDGQTVVELCKSPAIKGFIIGYLQELEEARELNVEPSESTGVNVEKKVVSLPSSSEDLENAQNALHPTTQDDLKIPE